MKARVVMRLHELRRLVGGWLTGQQPAAGTSIAEPAGGLLAQTLFAIALKSELAARLVSTDPSGARREMRDITTLARAALTGGGVTTPDAPMSDLRVEVAGASALLSAASIAVRAEVDISDPPPAMERVLVATVREGVLGVLRYGSASTCSITGGTRGRTLWLAISDDGARPAIPDDAGLRELADRARTLSGTMTATRTGDHQFQLLVEFPEEAT